MSAPPSDTLYDSPFAAAWYDTFYEEPPPEVAGDVAFYVAAARRCDGPVLELACGTGRVALPVATAGHEVVGLDASAAMLEVAGARAAALPDDVRSRLSWHRGLLQDFELGRRFLLALVPFRSFQLLLDTADQLACLVAIARHLEEDGTAIIHLFDPRLDYLTGQTPLPRIERHGHAAASGRSVVATLVANEIDPMAQTMRGTWRYIERDSGGRELRREDLTQALRWTWRFEFEHLAVRAGLRVVAEYSDFNGAPPAYGRERVTVLQRA